MVRLVPNHSEIFVSSLQINEVMRRLDLVTDQVNYSDEPELKYREGYLFNGSLDQNKFRLSLKLDRSDSFLPLIKGEIEPTGKGSIIFLNYSFFPATEFFLGFWGVITFLLTVFFLTFDQDWVFAVLSSLVGICNYAFAFMNFRRKVKESQKIFKEMMDLRIKG